MKEYGLSYTLNSLGKQLIAAAKEGDAERAKKLISNGAPFTVEVPVGNSALHFAALSGSVEMCLVILNAGFNVNAVNKVDKTALHLAATDGHVGVVYELLACGANPNLLDMLNMSALHWACARGHTDIVHVLIEFNAQIDIVNRFSKDPLLIAKENGHDNVVVLIKNFIENGCLPSRNIKLDLEINHHSNRRPQDRRSVFVRNKEAKEDGVPKRIKQEFEDNGDVLASLAELARTSSKGDGTAELSGDVDLDILNAQAALLPLNHQPPIYPGSIPEGQTLHFTEAGKQALEMVRPEPLLIPEYKKANAISVKEEKEDTEKEEFIGFVTDMETEVITISAEDESLRDETIVIENGDAMEEISVEVCLEENCDEEEEMPT